MRNAQEKIRREMRERKRATGAELSAVTGLSLVTVYKELAALAERGEVRECKQREPSRGGRPARVFESEPGYARRALLRAERQGNALLVTLEEMDLQGRQLRTETSSWARLEAQSLHAWVANALGGERMASIALAFEAQEEAIIMSEQLRRSFHCPVVRLTPAEALADAQENTTTLYLCPGSAPLCSTLRHGKRMRAGALGLLPMPGAWETLDYTDHTLVEEMVARLLQAISCVLAPKRIVAHAPFWSARLTERIRFNTQSKLKGKAPELSFRLCTAESAQAALRARACSL